MQESKTLFDEAFQALQQQRTKRLASSSHPLAQEARARLEERLADIKRDFPAQHEWNRNGMPAFAGMTQFFETSSKHDDLVFSCSPLSQDVMPAKAGIPFGSTTENEGYALITSVLTLQKANDLQGELEAIRTALADGGLFLGVLLGGNSLHELRTALMDAEIALTGGTAPRVAPMVDGETMSRLLSLAGFALPVVDVERVTLEYPDLQSLMHDLRAFGCANALSERSHRFAPRVFFNKAQDVYAARFATPSGGIAVTIDLIFLHGWREGN